jgi:hypothetical protein
VALAIDASSPAVAQNITAASTDTATTASFTPPANSLLVVLISGDTFGAGNNATWTITDNLATHLTWTQRVYSSSTDTPNAGGSALIYTAPVVTSAPMTVSVTDAAGSGTGDLYVLVQVITGGGAIPTVGANGKTSSATAGTSIAASYTATGTGSWGFAAVQDWNATGTMTAGGTGNTIIASATPNASFMSYGFARRTTADGVNGAATTITVNMGGSSTAKHIATLEVLDPGGGAAAASSSFLPQRAIRRSPRVRYRAYQPTRRPSMVQAAPPVVARPTYRSTVAAVGPTAWWRLDETSGAFVDSVGARNATVTGSPLYRQVPLATGSPSVDFDNSTLQYGDVAKNDAIFLTPQVSVEALLHADILSGDNRIIEYGSDGEGWILEYSSGSGGLLWWAQGHSASVAPFADTNVPHHVVGTYDSATGLGILYLDGVEVARDPGSSPGWTAPATAGLRIAGKPGGTFAGDGWNGRLAEVAVYATVLTPSQVAVHAAAAGKVTVSGQVPVTATVTAATTPVYYVSAAGSDAADGISPGTAWATIAKVNAATLNAGESVLFRGGDTFTGPVNVYASAGTATKPITFGSYGTGRATINAAGAAGIGFDIWEVAGVVVRDLILTGPGSTSTQAGVQLWKDTAGRANYVLVDNVDASGFKFGISIGGTGGGGFSNVTVQNCVLHGNLDSGLTSFGDPFTGSNYAHSNITVTGTSAFSNPGISTQTTLHTGSGIVLGSVTGGSIDQCQAHDNGASNGSTTQGPYGLWAYDSTAVVISRSVSYNNASGLGSIDGGGFGLDQNTSNSRIEYCLAYVNNGPGFLIFGLTSNSNNTGNTLRFNLSWGNCEVNSSGYGEITLSGNVLAASVYNNTAVSVTKGSIQPSPFAVSAVGGSPSSCTVRNNIFMARSTGPVVLADNAAWTTSALLFQGNDYYSTGTLNITWGGSSYTTLAAWRAAVANQEVTSGSNSGQTANPLLVTPASAPTVTDPTDTSGANGMALQAGSPMASSGLDLAALFGTSIGTRDYFGAAVSSPYSVGAAEYATAGVDAQVPVTDAVTGAATRGANVASSVPVTAAVTAAAVVGKLADSTVPLVDAVTGAATRTAGVDSSVPATATVTAAALRTAGVDSTVPVVDAVTAAATRGALVAATVPLAAAVTGTVSLGASVASTVPVVDAVTAAATRTANVDAAVPVTAGSTATATRTANVDAQAPATASVTGAATRGANADASVPVVAGTTGTVSLGAAAAATVPVVDAVTGTALRTAQVASSVPVAASITASTAGQASVDATVPVTASVTGSALRGANVAATVPVTAAVTGTVALGAAVASTVPVTASTTAAGTRGANVDAQVPVATAITASTAGQAAVAGTVPVAAAVTGSALRGANVAATVPVTAAVTGTATVNAAAASSVTAAAAVTATATRTAQVDAAVPITGAVTGAAGTQATTTATVPVTAGVTGTALRTTTAAGQVAVQVGSPPAVYGTAEYGTAVYGPGGITATATTAAGQLASAAVPVVAGVTGSATVQASVSSTVPVAAAATATALRTAQVASSVPVTAAVTGAVTLGAAVAASVPLAAGSTATATRTATVDAAVPVVDAVTATATRTAGVAATVPVVAGITGDATRGANAAATVPVTDSVTAAALRTAQVAATVPVTAGVAGTGSVATAGATATVPATANVTGAAKVTAVAAAAVPVTDATTGTAAVTARTSATVPLTAATTGTAGRTQAVAATAATITATVTGTALTAKGVSAQITATATITAAAVRTARVDGQDTVTATITAAAVVVVRVDGQTPVTATVTAAAARTVPVLAAVPVAAAVTADAQRDAAADGTVPVAAGITGSATAVPSTLTSAAVAVLAVIVASATTGKLRDVTLTAELLPPRWAAELAAERWTADLLPERWTTT